MGGIRERRQLILNSIFDQGIVKVAALARKFDTLKSKKS